jgi:hypothetical protein
MAAHFQPMRSCHCDAEIEINDERTQFSCVSLTMKCAICNKKLNIAQTLGNECRCGKVLCDMHKYPEEHACAFDYKTSAKEQLRSKNPIVAAQKIVPI